MDYPIRYIVRLLVEADTPLAVGAGEVDILNNAPVALDCNGLPMIPGTSLCGVLRHALIRQAPDDDEQRMVDDIFGYQGKEDGLGSRLVVSSAQLVGSDGQVIEGVAEIDETGEYYHHFFNLPVREHCRINQRGTADAIGHGKFDNLVVYKGSFFVFELELAGDADDKYIWDKMIAAIKSPLFRVGAGIRKGYGALKVKDSIVDIYDLTKPDGLEGYLERNSSLVGNSWDMNYDTINKNQVPVGFTAYKLTLTPDDFFLFGAGFGDQNVNIKPVVEKIITWQAGKPVFNDEMTLIPASSVKGAIAHRTAFHHNRLEKIYADDPSVDINDYVNEKNEAVQTLFGCPRADGRDTGQQGRVIVSDIFLPLPAEDEQKTLNHVALDRFTQGPIDGALFSELVFSGKEFTLELLVENSCLNGHVKDAFEAALTDITKGMLPLGGGVMRGHGFFSGNWKKGGK